MHEKHLYEYAVLRVVPKVEREEFINIGLLLFCKRQKYLRIEYHIFSDKIKSICKEYDVEQLTQNVESFVKIGKADTYDYGFWDSDLQRNSRIIALDTEDQVTRSFNDIKSTMKADNLRRMSIQNGLFENGIFARRVTLSEASSSDFTMRMVDEQ